MSRLERKCLVASAGAHAALFLILALAPWLWVSRPPQQITLPVLTFIPSHLVDGASSGGGSPNAKAAPAPAPPRAVQQPLALAPPAPKPQPAPVRQEARVTHEEVEAPAKPRRRKSGEAVPSDHRTVETEESDDAGDAKSSRKKKVEISLVRASGNSREKTAAEARSDTEAASRAAQALYASKVRGVLGAIGQAVSAGTAIDIPGPGGEAFADYGQFVILVYKRAWTPPPELSDELATVKVKVTILRDGTVESFKIMRRSGHSGLDKSVERLEKNVRFVAHFPEGAPDERRTFIINFNLTL